MAEGFGELRLGGVTRRFGAAVALDRLDLTIRRGEFIALLGPSGCGKSTALNCIAGLLPLSGGGIWLDDKRIDVLRPEQRGFGMVFQNYALFPHMSVRKNIGFGLAMRQEITPADTCDRPPFTRNEGVPGSSPGVGSTKTPGDRGFLLPI